MKDTTTACNTDMKVTVTWEVQMVETQIKDKIYTRDGQPKMKNLKEDEEKFKNLHRSKKD
jgi:hypothetical protein